MRSNKAKTLSKTAKRVIKRFFVSIIALVAALTGGYFTAWFICMQFSWSGQEPLYILLKILEQLSPTIVFVSLIVGGIIFMVQALKKLSYIDLSYIDDVIAAAKTVYAFL